MYQTAEGIWVQNSRDEYIRKEQHEYKAIREIFAGRPRVRVWDIGAHVGWFTWYLRQHLQPQQILCVECSPRQLEALRKNVQENTKILEGALVPDTYKEETVLLYLNMTGNSAGDSTFCKIRGRESTPVKAIKVADIKELLPDPDLIKLDCEGAEYHIEPAKHIPNSASAVVAEIHYHRKGQKELFHQFNEGMLSIGFKQVKPFKFNDFRGCSHVSYSR